MPSELVNSVISRPQPPRPRMTRRKSVSVTPAIGASTAAGRMVKSRIWKDAGIIALSFNAQFNPDLRHAAADCFKIGIKRSAHGSVRQTVRSRLSDEVASDKNEKDADDPQEVPSAGTR